MNVCSHGAAVAVFVIGICRNNREGMEIQDDIMLQWA